MQNFLRMVGHLGAERRALRLRVERGSERNLRLLIREPVEALGPNTLREEAL